MNVLHLKSEYVEPQAHLPNSRECLSQFTLTSDWKDGHHQLEDAVDEGERKHDLQLSRAEGQLDNGAAQLGVLETRL